MAQGTITAALTGGVSGTLEIDWEQKPAAGKGYSEIKVTIKLTRTGGGALGGTWYASGDGAIKVGGESVWTWTKNATPLPVPSTPGTKVIKEATIQVAHSAATSIAVEIGKGSWYNTSSSKLGCAWAEKTEAIALEALLSYTLTITAGENTSVTVKRNGAALESGAAIYSGDVLRVEASASAGHDLTLTIDGKAASSGDTVTVAGDVAVAAQATLRAATYAKYTPYIGTAAGWARLS